MRARRTPHRRPHRFDDVAVLLHWLIALLIIALLVIGKTMTALADDDPLRFSLTQWHKSIGITVLLLSLGRLLWRLTHRPPGHPPGAPAWERIAAGLSHLLLYGLTFALPVSGWILVSASPLEIDTLLYNAIPWPHLPPFDTLANREAVAEAFDGYHALAANVLIALLLLHVGAAFKHHLIDRDDVLRRMAPDWRAPAFRRKTQAGVVIGLLAAIGLWQYGAGRDGRTESPLIAGDSAVGFVAMITGSALEGEFTDTEVDFTFDASRPEAGVLEARVATGSFRTDTPQIDSSLGDEDWFDVANHPSARFRSTAIRPPENGVYPVEGELTIKGISKTVTLPLRLRSTDAAREASGEFDINRLDFDIGADSQPDDEYVDLMVRIRFRFELSAATAR